MFLFILAVLQVFASVGTLGFNALVVNGKHPRNILFISNCADEYGVPVIGVLCTSSRASASSFPPSFAFLNNFLTVYTLCSASLLD